MYEYKINIKLYDGTSNGAPRTMKYKSRKKLSERQVFENLNSYLAENYYTTARVADIILENTEYFAPRQKDNGPVSADAFDLEMGPTTDKYGDPLFVSPIKRKEAQKNAHMAVRLRKEIAEKLGKMKYKYLVKLQQYMWGLFEDQEDE